MQPRTIPRMTKSQFNLVKVVNAILHKLKSGGRWRMLPVGHLFTGKTTLLYHHQKVCRKCMNI